MEFFQVRTTRPYYLVQYALIPSYHVMKRYHAGGMPKHMYGTHEMMLLEAKFIDLQLAVFEFLTEINPT